MTVARQARREMISVLTHDLNACPDAVDTLMYPGSLDDTWVMPWHSGSDDLRFKLWFVEHFADRETFRGSKLVLGAVDSFFSDLARLHWQTTGESIQIDRGAVRNLKSRLLTAMFPTWKSVVDEATGRSAERAQRNLQRLVIENGSWQTR